MARSKKKKKKKMPRGLKLGLIAGVMGVFVAIASFVLLVVTDQREYVSTRMDRMTSRNYGGAVEQKAPKINAISSESKIYDQMSVDYTLSDETVEEFVENTNLKSTKGRVEIDVDLVKRGLRYEPTYNTEFEATYILENLSDEEVAVEFEFPFPENVVNKEINGAKLLVDGEEQKNPVRREETTVEVDPYDSFYNEQEQVAYKSGLYWDGKIDANSEKEIKVEYKTVGLSTYVYEGLENPKGSQDFDFEIRVVGSRKYDNLGTLSINKREYITEEGENGVVLKWKKPDLFSKPDVRVDVATRVNPSRHMAEIYKIMVPLYIFFAVALVTLVCILDKDFGGFDMVLMSGLFIVFFPFLHYLVSFNIDPSADVLTNVSGIIEFSMPLYGAFGIALGLVGGIMIYLLSRVRGSKFAFGVGLPLVFVTLAFFPLAMTLPEYKYLLVLFGVVAILALVVQMRVSRKLTRKQKKS